ncbi:hypothetical protein OKW21_000609 [Catalinimonas alkaloidigena]|uniref:hypothetical protein n=1 Tax=Catalinimonas alkaloidigena TaxID=1075417 RepID=UPI002404D0F1|nr:hypothetical protein [Catalinimonas alkaloidigena]MDF9795346.1 hypothetical protein [Catalinimonas alkaloidigena]
MTTQENHTLQKYSHVVEDIMNNRSTSQMLRKNYLIDNGVEKVAEDTIYGLRQMVAKKKAELRRKGLNGIDAQDITAPNSEVVGSLSMTNAGGYKPQQPMTTSSTGPAYADERPAPNYMQAPVSDMQAHVQNAELRAEIRFLKHQLSSTEKELGKLQNEGLGNTNLNTEHIFLKRDFSDLQKQYDEAKKKLESLEPEYEDLKEDAKTWAKLEKAATLITSQPQMFISVLSAINPVAGRNAASALAGMSGEQQQLPAGSQTAMQIAQAIDQAFNQDEQRQLAQIINHCASRKELVTELAYMLQRRLEEIAAKAEKLTAEGSENAEMI